MPQVSIRVTTPPTSTLLMDPAVAGADLNFEDTSENLAIATKLVTRVSALIATELGFDPAYRLVEEGFAEIQGREIQLAGRPLNTNPAHAVTTVQQPAYPIDDPSPPPPLVYLTDYTVRYAGRRSGEGSIFSANGWPPGGWDWGRGWPVTTEGAGGVDWLVTYPCGWWLPMMTGSAPSGVPLLPDDLVQACWSSVQQIYSDQQRDPNVQSIRKADREVTYRKQVPTRNAYGAPERILSNETVELLERYQVVVL
jgi:hypothetical protein